MSMESFTRIQKSSLKWMAGSISFVCLQRGIWLKGEEVTLSHSCHYVGTKIEFWNFSITKNVRSVYSYM